MKLFLLTLSGIELNYVYNHLRWVVSLMHAGIALCIWTRLARTRCLIITLLPFWNGLERVCDNVSSSPDSRRPSHDQTVLLTQRFPPTWCIDLQEMSQCCPAAITPIQAAAIQMSVGRTLETWRESHSLTRSMNDLWFSLVLVFVRFNSCHMMQLFLYFIKNFCKRGS